MVGDTDDVREIRREGVGGHRTAPHTADLRIEAWAPSREGCLAEAVRGMVECFADVSAVRPTHLERIRFARADDADLLAALLDEVVYRVEVHGQVPVEVDAETVADGDLEVRLGVVPLADVEITGAAPKAVSWHGLHMGADPYGWSCAVTVDV
ncbi:archease [Streptomyces mexicanus]|jgi:SHS2 domain-containing protein|uniref:archease n=1 Tax=Streptomyces mexicanus TaxID=178566 RepID=UPI0031E81910